MREPYARHARIEIDRLAALIIGELGESQIDRDPILVQAGGFVDEVDDEHGGVLHTADAIGSLLQARLVCGEDQLGLPASELATAAARILAPLLAQRACVLVSSAEANGAFFERSSHLEIVGSTLSGRGGLLKVGLR